MRLCVLTVYKGRLLQPIFRIYTKLLAVISPNRAASKEDEFIVERSYSFLDHAWTGGRSESWYLECLAVHPDYQKRGQGRVLANWGLKQAREEGISCSVISADGKERFYQACGFDVGPVARAGEGEGNPLREVAGGLMFVKEKEGLVLPDREFGAWTYGPPGVFDWDGWRKTVESRNEKAKSSNDSTSTLAV